MSKKTTNGITENNNEVEWKKFPYEITDIDPALNEELLKDFTGERSTFVQVGPKKWFFPSGYRKDAEIYYNFQPRIDDVWVVTFPRSGTTWTQELVWLLANKLNFSKAREIPLTQRFPFLEFDTFVHPLVREEFLAHNSYSEERCAVIEEALQPEWKNLVNTNHRRFIKTHLPFELLPPNLLSTGCKVIYVARNPKDVAVSFYHLNRAFKTQGYLGDFPKYWNYFKNGLQPWTPYWSHIQQGFEQRNEENLLFLFYEDMHKDLNESIQKLSKFLNVEYTNEEYMNLTEHLKIENFVNNKSINMELFVDLGIINKDEGGFVRKGQKGGWANYFNDTLNKDADEWIKENIQTTNIKFPK